MLNSDLSPAAPQGGREPPQKKRMVSTRRRVLTNWVSGRTLKASIESVVANSFAPSNFLVNVQVCGLGTVHPLLTLSVFSTWILPLHVVSCFQRLRQKSSSSVMDGLQRKKKIASYSADVLAYQSAAYLLRDPVNERKNCRGFIFFICLGLSTHSIHDPLNNGFRVTIGHTGGLYMLFLAGWATRLDNDVGGSVVTAYYHTALDVLRMLGVKSKALSGVGGVSVYGSHMVVVDVPVYQVIKKRNLVVVSHFNGEVDGLLLCVHVQRSFLTVDLVETMKVSSTYLYQILRVYSGRRDVRVCCSNISINILTTIAEAGLPIATPSSSSLKFPFYIK